MVTKEEYQEAMEAAIGPLAAALLQDTDTGWVYLIGPNLFQALSEGDPVNEVQTSIDAGLLKDDRLVLNYIQISALRNKWSPNNNNNSGIYRPDGSFI